MVVVWRTMASMIVWSSLVQVMAWHLFGTKPLPEPLMTICKRGHIRKEITSLHRISAKSNWKCRLQNASHFVHASMCQHLHQYGGESVDQIFETRRLTLSSLVALQIVVTPTCSAVSDDKIGIMTTFGFPWKKMCGETSTCSDNFHRISPHGV